MVDIDKLDPIKPEMMGMASLESRGHLMSGLLNAELAHRIEVNCKNLDGAPTFIHGALVKNSVISSVCALEAHINEWFSSFQGLEHVGSKKISVISRLWSLDIPRTARYSILDKYQIALTLMSIDEFKEGQKPYQSVKNLIKLRNALVHYEPTFEPLSSQTMSNEYYKEHSLGRNLLGLFELNPLCADSAPIWPYKIFGSGCAKWSSLAALDLIESFNNKDVVKMTNTHFYDDREELLKQVHSLANSNWSKMLSPI